MTFDDLFHAEILSVATDRIRFHTDALITKTLQGDHHESTRLAGVIQTLATALPEILAEARENISKR